MKLRLEDPTGGRKGNFARPLHIIFYKLYVYIRRTSLTRNVLLGSGILPSFLSAVAPVYDMCIGPGMSMANNLATIFDWRHVGNTR